MKSFLTAFAIITILIYNFLSIKAQTDEQIESKFGDFSLTAGSLKIKARLFIPDVYNDSTLYPLVVTLHGLGECGSDNRVQVLYNHIATTWGTDEFQSKNPCFIFSPQCPVNFTWNSSSVYKSVMILLDSLIRNYSIDITRIYLTGLSLGGNGTWSFLLNKPDFYAAAVPVCGWMDNPDISKIKSIAHIPVWIFHGKVDNIVSVSSPRDIIMLYEQLNLYPVLTHDFNRLSIQLDDTVISRFIDDQTDLLYSEVPDVGHDVWNTAYQMQLMKKWMFLQRRRDKNNIIVEKNGSCKEIEGTSEINFSTSEKVRNVGIWLEQPENIILQFLDTIPASYGVYHFESESFEDFPYYRLKFLAFDSEGLAIGKDYTDTLWINNPGNSAPYIALVNDWFLSNSTSPPDYIMRVSLTDPESDPLDVKFLVSYDNGETFEILEEFMDVTARYLELPINFRSLINTSEMIIRIEVTDGELTSSTQTLNFYNGYGYFDYIPAFMSGSFNLYPNPAKGCFYLEMVSRDISNYFIQILSMDGRIRQEWEQKGIKPGRSIISIETSKLEPGLYLMNIENNREKVYIKKIIVL